MNNDTISGRELNTRKVRVVYKVRTFYAHCPCCDRSHKCRHEDDGSFTLVCGCMRDGIYAIRYLIDASEIVVRDDTKFRLIDVPVERSFESEWR